jgi:hypothetical protein
MSESIASLQRQAREWQAEADIAGNHTRPMYVRMAHAYAYMASLIEAGAPSEVDLAPAC